MKLLSLDPSSTCIGYAVWSDSSGRMIVMEHGRLKPQKSTADIQGRIRSLADELAKLVVEFDPDVIVIEVMLGRQYTASGNKQRTTSLPTCAVSMGFMWRVCCGLDATTIAVDNLAWTRGRSKESRKVRARQLCSAYDQKQDQGGDAADAICLGDWYIQRQKQELVRRSTKGS
jgi:hypothetical protein